MSSGAIQPLEPDLFIRLRTFDRDHHPIKLASGQDEIIEVEVKVLGMMYFRRYERVTRCLRRGREETLAFHAGCPSHSVLLPSETCRGHGLSSDAFFREDVDDRWCQYPSTFVAMYEIKHWRYGPGPYDVESQLHFVR